MSANKENCPHIQGIARRIAVGMSNAFPFNLVKTDENVTSKTYKILLLNGPEAFHPLLLEAFKGISFDYIIGKSNHPEAMKYTQIQDWLLADQKVIAAHTIYSFCGYSTLMDVVALGCEWKSIPTPGQWEQHFLRQRNSPYLNQ